MMSIPTDSSTSVIPAKCVLSVIANRYLLDSREEHGFLLSSNADQLVSVSIEMKDAAEEINL